MEKEKKVAKGINWILNNKLKTIRIIVSIGLFYFATSFLKLGLDILSLPYFVESVEKIPEQYHFIVLAGFLYIFIRLAMLLFNHGYYKFLDIFEED